MKNLCMLKLGMLILEGPLAKGFEVYLFMTCHQVVLNLSVQRN